ncbi:MAG: hypothetical protein U0Q11_27210 [Vicinamibacterales bacterium]
MPATKMAPVESTATAVAPSLSSPPRNVEKTSAPAWIELRDERIRVALERVLHRIPQWKVARLSGADDDGVALGVDGEVADAVESAVPTRRGASSK